MNAFTEPYDCPICGASTKRTKKGVVRPHGTQAVRLGKASSPCAENTSQGQVWRATQYLNDPENVRRRMRWRALVHPPQTVITEGTPQRRRVR